MKIRTILRFGDFVSSQSERLRSTKQLTTNTGEVTERRASFSAGGDANWCRHSIHHGGQA